MRQTRCALVKQILIILTSLAALILLSCVREAPVPKQTAVPPAATAAAPPAQQTPVPKQRPWAIIYAFEPEGAQLRKAASLSKDTVWAGRALAYGWLVQPVVIAASGIGMTNAAATAQHIIDVYNPAAIIFTGICGAINPQHQIGDIVIPDQWLIHDHGYWGKNGFKTDSVEVGSQHMLDMPVDTSLARQLADAGDAVAFRFRTVMGRIPEVRRGGLGVSGDAFIDSKAKREQLFRDFQAEIVDMESAAVVQTARASGIPVAIVRSCSDLAGGSGPQTAQQQLKEFFDVTAYNSSLVVQQFLETNY